MYVLCVVPVCVYVCVVVRARNFNYDLPLLCALELSPRWRWLRRPFGSIFTATPFGRKIVNLKKSVTFGVYTLHSVAD